ncbi:MAG: FtsH protease activity modulator HflK [Gammaproteobacteria bacterium]|nr:MAG: FtsH protease activity modulator HflK [Gammaproteobacteria bacterium]
MAWNEPGNSGDNDNRQQGNKSDGPPDLEEIIAKLKNSIMSLFGGSGSYSGKTNSSGSGLGIFAVVFLVVAVAYYIVSGIYVIEEGVKGVVLRFGRFQQVFDSGLHWAPKYIDTVIKVDTSKRNKITIGASGSSSKQKKEDAMMLTQDENLINGDLGVQYVIKNPRDYALNILNQEENLKQVTESVLREVISSYRMDDILKQDAEEVETEEKKDKDKNDIKVSEIKTKIQEILDKYEAGIEIKQVTLDRVLPPEEVREAFEKATKAREVKQWIINKANAYREKLIPVAEGEAARIIADAEGYRSEVIFAAEGDAARFTLLMKQYRKNTKITKERLYLDAMTEILSKNGKVLLDSKRDNNVMYLPIDKLMNKKNNNINYRDGDNGEIAKKTSAALISENSGNAESTNSKNTDANNKNDLGLRDRNIQRERKER